MIVAECIHYNMCTRPTVEDIAYNVQRVDGEALNEVTHGNDEIVGTLGRDNGY